MSTTISRIIEHDELANRNYAALYQERRTSRIALVCVSALLAVSVGSNVLLAHRPIQTRYIRIDDMRRAQAIQYSDLRYTPQEGEIHNYLSEWANDRYTITRDAILTSYPRNFYFLQKQLAERQMASDQANHFRSKVLSNQIESGVSDVQNVAITSLTTETIQGATIGRGTALINLTRTFSAETSRAPRREQWLVSVTYYINPEQVNELAKVFPQYEDINPLGMTITAFVENRVSVTPLNRTEAVK